jgi:uncharacterized protein
MPATLPRTFLPMKSCAAPLRPETDLTDAELELLGQRGVNCLRYFPGHGLLVWGARTATADPDYKYVPVRRYTIFLEASIRRGLQWTVFEPNGEQLWNNVSSAVSNFLVDQWRSGAAATSQSKRSSCAVIVRP